jgi:hypothetical protein
MSLVLKVLPILLRCCIICRRCIICRISTAVSLPYVHKIGSQIATRCGIIRHPNGARLNPKALEHLGELGGRSLDVTVMELALPPDGPRAVGFLLY